HPTTQARWHRRAIPPPQGLEGLGPIAQARQPYALAPAHPLDAGRGPGPLLLQGVHVPVQMAVILGLHRGPLHHLPHLPLTVLRRIFPPLLGRLPRITLSNHWCYEAARGEKRLPTFCVNSL